MCGNTALHYAAARCHIDSVKLLLNHNLEIELQDYLYIDIINNNALNTYEKEVVELFITHAVKDTLVKILTQKLLHRIQILYKIHQI
ncbi:ankyrin repeat domain-containing protein [Orientia tsutsugamushi]|uniref:ankyrin repeat domain-containing protein n=1 Tax=Orientia tsutsugamushi TaxID=784 RepID=UPI001E46543E|nr:ankyrin repeat domain-containing protein [Orientia tsutsugamushi]